MKYRNKFLIPVVQPDGSSLPNVYHFYGDQLIDGERYVGLIQEGLKSQSPLWIRDTNFRDMFDPIP